MNIDDLRLYLRLDTDTGDLQQLYEAAKIYIVTSTGKKFDEENALMCLCAKMLTAHWYENRGVEGIGNAKDYNYTVTAILAQIQQNPDFEDVNE